MILLCVEPSLATIASGRGPTRIQSDFFQNFGPNFQLSIHSLSVVVSKIFYFHPDPWGRWSNLALFFFKWVAQPPTSFVTQIYRNLSNDIQNLWPTSSKSAPQKEWKQHCPFAAPQFFYKIVLRCCSQTPQSWTNEPMNGKPSPYLEAITLGVSCG